MPLFMSLLFVDTSTVLSPNATLNSTTNSSLENAATPNNFEEFDTSPPASSASEGSSSGADPTGQDAVSERVTQLTSVVLSLAPVFSPTFMRGVLAFAVWWTTFVMIVTSGFGIIYYEYFAISMTGV